MSIEILILFFSKSLTSKVDNVMTKRDKNIVFDNNEEKDNNTLGHTIKPSHKSSLIIEIVWAKKPTQMTKEKENKKLKW